MSKRVWVVEEFDPEQYEWRVESVWSDEACARAHAAEPGTTRSCNSRVFEVRP